LVKHFNQLKALKINQSIIKNYGHNTNAFKQNLNDKLCSAIPCYGCSDVPYVMQDLSGGWLQFWLHTLP